MSRAIVMHRTGAPDVLALEDRPLRPLAAGEVRVRTLASAVNFSDLRIRAGDWRIRKASPFPYVPGLEVVGDVVEVAADVTTCSPGDRVWTTMQGTGGVRAERDGGYAEHVTLPATVVAPLPAGVDPVQFAALGLAGVTALESLRRLGPIRGKTIAIAGTAGGVGASAVGVARALGAEVIPLTRSTPPLDPGSVDGALDGVAGPVFPMLVAALRPGGRYCMYGAAAGGTVSFDAWQLLDGRTLTGYSSEDLDGDALRSATRELLELRLAPPPHTVMSLADAARAHAMLEERTVQGRIVLTPP